MIRVPWKLFENCRFSSMFWHQSSSFVATKISIRKNKNSSFPGQKKSKRLRFKIEKWIRSLQTTPKNFFFFLKAHTGTFMEWKKKLQAMRKARIKVNCVRLMKKIAPLHITWPPRFPHIPCTIFTWYKNRIVMLRIFNVTKSQVRRFFTFFLYLFLYSSSLTFPSLRSLLGERLLTISIVTGSCHVSGHRFPISSSLRLIPLSLKLFLGRIWMWKRRKRSGRMG